MTGCPLPSTGVAQGAGPYALTVALTVPRQSHMPWPQEGTKTGPRPKGDPGLRATPPFWRKKAGEVSPQPRGRSSIPHPSGQEGWPGSAWAGGLASQNSGLAGSLQEHADCGGGQGSRGGLAGPDPPARPLCPQPSRAGQAAETPTPQPSPLQPCSLPSVTRFAACARPSPHS